MIFLPGRIDEDWKPGATNPTHLIRSRNIHPSLNQTTIRLINASCRCIHLTFHQSENKAQVRSFNYVFKVSTHDAMYDNATCTRNEWSNPVRRVSNKLFQAWEMEGCVISIILYIYNESHIPPCLLAVTASSQPTPCHPTLSFFKIVFLEVETCRS